MAHPMRHDMNTASKKPTAEVEEFSGKTLPQARALAARYGYTTGGFVYICGALCVIRFQETA